MKGTAENSISLLTEDHSKCYFNLHFIKVIYDRLAKSLQIFRGYRLESVSAARTGPDFWGANQMTSKIFVPSESKCKLIGTIKDDNLQETCNSIQCYRHFLNILLLHQPYKMQT